MTTAARASGLALPTSDALRRAALARAARRGARVAFWRLGFRWLWWASGWLLVLLGALAVVAVLLWGLWRATLLLWQPASAVPPLPTATPTAVPTATVAAPAVRYPLRLDDSEPQFSQPAAAQSRPASSPPRAPP